MWFRVKCALGICVCWSRIPASGMCSLMPAPPPCTDAVLKDGGLFAMQALPLSLVSADLYVRSGLELDSFKLS